MYTGWSLIRKILHRPEQAPVESECHQIDPSEVLSLALLQVTKKNRRSADGFIGLPWFTMVFPQQTWYKMYKMRGAVD